MKGINFDVYHLMLMLCDYMLKHPLLIKQPETIEEWNILQEKIEKEYGKQIDVEAEICINFCEEYSGNR